MKMSDLISVIVPVYKVEEYLDRCVESIVNQTYTNLEIILVDDGSPDNCPQMCDDWAKKDNRIKVIHKENGGLSDARNAGLDIAQGEYIGFVDSDDYIHSKMYELLYKSIISNNSDMSICDTRIVDEDGNSIINKNLFSPFTQKNISGKMILEQKLFEKVAWKWIVVWPKLYAKCLFENVRFLVGKINEDEFIAQDIFVNCANIVCVNEQLYYYVQRNGSITNSNFSFKNFDSLEAMLRRLDFYLNNDYPSNTILNCYMDCSSLLNNLYFNMDCSIKDVRLKYNNLKTIYRNLFFKAIKTSASIKDFILYSSGIFSGNFYSKVFDAYKKAKNMFVRIYCRIYSFYCLLKYTMKVNDALCLLVDTPNHGNIGDQAIAQTEKYCLTKEKYSFIEITADEFNYKEKQYAYFTSDKKTIYIHGGGFLGSLWKNEEERFRRILVAFKNNRIIVFPQTITFDTTTEDGLSFMRESQKIYSSHPNLTIFVREQKSYDFMREYFPSVDCRLVPDIVTILEANVKQHKRKDILFCFRSDREKYIKPNDISEIEYIVSEIFPNDFVHFTDTVLDYGVSVNDREAEVIKKLQQFADSKLVITDRLHGMIFASITGTPCIALGNINGKVKAVYKWLESLDYVKYAENINNVRTFLNQMDFNKEYKYNKDLLENDFSPLFEVMSEMETK
ncbi:glycosyltransferase [Eubacterium sp.]